MESRRFQVFGQAWGINQMSHVTVLRGIMDVT